MSEHLEQTIEHLRKLIAEQQLRLNERTQILAAIVPHLQTWSEESGYESGSASYICAEILEKYGTLIDKFKEEYNKEMGMN